MLRPSLTSGLAFLTGDVPGAGGVVKAQAEDFVVEELPLYPASGQGEHLFLYLEKRERTTPDVVRRLAKLFNVRRSDIGYAGLKDKLAVTRQCFSIWLPRPDEEARALERLEFTGLKLLWSRRHGNKLRRGHLAGNRFAIRLRQVDLAAAPRVRDVLERLARLGAPNYVGPQRFGYRQDNHLLGRLLLRQDFDGLLRQMLGRPDALDGPTMHAAREAFERGDYDAALAHWPRRYRHDRQALDFLRQGRTARRAVLDIDRQQLEFLLNAFQSAVFNVVLDARVRRAQLDRLCAGDLAVKHDNGALFAVDEATAARENAPDGRVRQLAVSATGPMWGRSMPRPGGAVLQEELAALAAHGATEADFEAAEGPAIDGARRPLRAVLRNPEVDAGSDEHGPFLALRFDLPPGSYATVVLREVTKTDAPPPSVEAGPGPEAA